MLSIIRGHNFDSQADIWKPSLQSYEKWHQLLYQPGYVILPGIRVVEKMA